MICAEEYSLGTADGQRDQLGSLDRREIGASFILKIQFQRFLQIRQRLLFGFSKAGYVNVETLANIVPALFPEHSF